MKPVYYCIAIFLLVMVYAFVSGDRLPLEYAKTFDMKYYVDMTTHFSDHLAQQDFSKYYNSRLFIPFIAHYLFRLLHIDFDPVNIQIAFSILNIISISIALITYMAITRIKAYSPPIILLGFSLLLVNFFILKLPGFYPVLMDVFGFTSGLLLYYFHVANKKAGFYICLVLSMFVFPTTSLIVIALIGSSVVKFNDKGLNLRKYLTAYTYVLTIGMAIGIILICFKMKAYIPNPNIVSYQEAPYLMPLTLILLFGILFVTVKQLLLLADGLSLKPKGILSRTFVLGIGVYLLFWVSSKYLSAHFQGANVLSAKALIVNLFYQAVSFPIKFLISGFIYYGAFVIMLLVFYKQFFAHVKEHADSFSKILVVAFILFSFGTETRQFLQFLPFVMFLFLDAVRKYNFDFKLVFGIFTFQLLWSRFWYNINTPEGFLVNTPPESNFLKFPAQRYFQFHGPWLSTDNSIVYGIIFLVAYFILRTIIKRRGVASLPESANAAD